jgi:gamma-glutamyltranspeptidase/glutathione hydrolase
LLSDNFSNSQVVRKSVVATRGGVVAAQHRRAAEAGAAVLEDGGDAVDAAIAVSFAIGVLEPWMSGPAAGGCMTIWRASEAKAHAIDYGMRCRGSWIRPITRSPGAAGTRISSRGPW